MKPHDPMSLESLPEYLKSLKENDTIEGSPLVEMGQIIEPKRSYLLQILGAMLVFAVLSVGSVATYNAMSTKQMTVVVDVTDPLTIPKIVSDSEGQVLSVTHTEDSTYEFKVATRKSEKSFLEWLRKNKDVKKVELNQ